MCLQNTTVVLSFGVRKLKFDFYTSIRFSQNIFLLSSFCFFHSSFFLFFSFAFQKTMTDWLGSVKDIVSLVADNEAILRAGGLALISGAGVIPRVGLVRALSLGFKSYFKTTYPLSIRKSDINQLSNSLLWMQKGNYITVTGGKGIGKTCLIDTTLNRHLGVVKISVSCLSYSIVVNEGVK